MREITRKDYPRQLWGRPSRNKELYGVTYSRQYTQTGKDIEPYSSCKIEHRRPQIEPTVITHLTPSVIEAIEEKFIRLRDKWKTERGPESSPSRLALHPAYQAIIGMGPDVVPFLLRELEQRVDFWFWALHAITEEDPSTPESRGNGKEMAKAWLNWGRNKGYTW